MKWFKFIVITVIIIVSVVVGYLYFLLSSALPQLDGEFSNQGVSDPTQINRDAKGVIQIEAKNQVDAMYALGFAHAQDRLFQMDLLRRNAAGELSELFGPAALPRDQITRFFQFRKRAAQAFAQQSAEQQRLARAYTDGVNGAIEQMKALPFEYQLTGNTIKPWQVEDSFLAIYSMYVDLQGSQVRRDLTLTLIKTHFGEDMVNFLLAPSPFQAALDGSRLPLRSQPVPALVMPESTDDNNNLPKTAMIEDDYAEGDIGSNSWAVSQQHTDNGLALLSNDMHLGLNVPAIWYKAQLSYSHQGKAVNVAGVTLPGAPGVIVGANHHIAWGFTNANVDNVDWIALPDDYPTQSIEEIITTTDGDTSYTIEMSNLGPVYTMDGQRYALAWVALTPYATNFELLNLAHSQSLDDAIGVAQEVRIPAQNMMLADASGAIAYRLTGAVTARTAMQNFAITPAQFDPLWSNPDRNTPIYRSPQYPKMWTANARVLSDKEHARYGDGGYAMGVRGLQIADAMRDQDIFAAQDFIDLQLDNRAVFISQWHARLLALLQQSPEQYGPYINALQNWQACACADDVGYTLARKFRTQVIYGLMDPLYRFVTDKGESFSPIQRHLEPAVVQILTQQPESWLPSPYANYDTFLFAMFDKAIQQLADKHANGDKLALSQFAWGNVNPLEVGHPISRQVPFLASFLNMPSVPGFGDSFMPAVQNGNHGASQRFVIQPGDIENGIMTIPGGQSGHPLSPFYRGEFATYAAHENAPLLPGEKQHTLVLTP